MIIKILGVGCSKCNALENITREVITELAVNATIEHVRDMNKIMEYPVFLTPGLVIDEKLVSSGNVPSKAEVATYIANAMS